MRRFVEKIKWMLLFAGIAAFLALMFMMDIFITISYAIGGEIFFIIPLIILTTVYFTLFGWIPWRIHVIHSDDGRKQYLEKLGSERFDAEAAKADRKRDKGFKIELIAYAVCVIVETIVVMFKVTPLIIIAAPVMFLVFWLFDRQLYVNIREAWADARIRLNPDGPDASTNNGD